MNTKSQEYAQKSFDLSEHYIKKFLEAISTYLQFSVVYGNSTKKDIVDKRNNIAAWIEYHRRRAVEYNTFHPVLKLRYMNGNSLTTINEMDHIIPDDQSLRRLHRAASRLV